MTIDKNVVLIYVAISMLMISSAVCLRFETSRQKKSFFTLREQYDHLLIFRKSMVENRVESTTTKNDLNSIASKISDCFSAESDCQFEYKISENKNDSSVVFNGKCSRESFMSIIKRLCFSPEEYSFSVDSSYIKFMFKFKDSQNRNLNIPVSCEIDENIFCSEKLISQKNNNAKKDLKDQDVKLIEIGSSYDREKGIEIIFYKDSEGSILKKTTRKE